MEIDTLTLRRCFKCYSEYLEECIARRYRIKICPTRHHNVGLKTFRPEMWRPTVNTVIGEQEACLTCPQLAKCLTLKAL